MKQFSTDNRFFDCMGSVGDWMILNILFIFTSLPVLTIGMSMTAMYQVMLRRARGESNYAVKEYLRGCRSEWKQSTKLWLIFLLTGALLLFDILYSENLWKGFGIAIGCMASVWCMVFCYAFPLQARFRNSIMGTLKNSLYLALRYLPYTLLLVLLNSIPFLCIAAGPFAVSMAMPIYCVAGFSLTARINSMVLTKIFRVFSDEEEAV